MPMNVSSSKFIGPLQLSLSRKHIDLCSKHKLLLLKLHDVLPHPGGSSIIACFKRRELFKIKHWSMDSFFEECNFVLHGKQLIDVEIAVTS